MSWEPDRAKAEPPRLGGLTEGGWVWLGADGPKGDDDLHSTNRTIQTMLMKCLGGLQPGVFNFCSLMVQQLLSALLGEDGRRTLPAPLHSVTHLLSHVLRVHLLSNLSLQSWISKVLCSSVEKGFVGEGVVRWRERPSRAAHWASKASSCCCGGGWVEGEDGAMWDGAAQLSAPLKVTLPLDGWRGAGFTEAGCGGFMKGLTLPTA